MAFLGTGVFVDIGHNLYFKKPKSEKKLRYESVVLLKKGLKNKNKSSHFFQVLPQKVYFLNNFFCL